MWFFMLEHLDTRTVPLKLNISRAMSSKEVGIAWLNNILSLSKVQFKPCNIHLGDMSMKATFRLLLSYTSDFLINNNTTIQ